MSAKNLTIVVKVFLIEVHGHCDSYICSFFMLFLKQKRFQKVKASLIFKQSLFLIFHNK